MALREENKNINKKLKEKIVRHDTKLNSPSATTMGRRRLTAKPGQPSYQDTQLPPASRFKALPVNPFAMTAEDRLSTFALDVDTASYSLGRRYIRRGYRPPAASVRIEEYLNSFDYNYPTQAGHTFNVYAQVGPSPFRPEMTLLKIGIKGKVIGRDNRKRAHLVFVVDASGSMSRADRLPLIIESLKALRQTLDPQDRLTVISYREKATLLLENALVGQVTDIEKRLENIQTGGATNILSGLALGYQLAANHFQAGQVNRVVLCSDGVANVGETQAASMLEEVKHHRDQGISLSCVGFGFGAFNDALLEDLSNKGDGNYLFVDSLQKIQTDFVPAMSAALQMIAKDARIQVSFNPQRVRRYRLIGYENRVMADKDFRNDKVDAGEVGSGQSVTALYELELNDPGKAGLYNTADLGTVYVRHRNIDTGAFEEIAQRLSVTLNNGRNEQARARFLLAACIAEWAEVLRGSEYTQTKIQTIRNQMITVAKALPLDKQVQELYGLIERSMGSPRAP